VTGTKLFSVSVWNPDRNNSYPPHRYEFGPPKFFSKTFKFSIIFYSVGRNPMEKQIGGFSKKNQVVEDLSVCLPKINSVGFEYSL